MSTPRFLLSMLILLFIAGCSNAELGYNEKVTAVFLSQMNSLDEDQKIFSDTTALFHADKGDSISLDIKADNLIKNADFGLDDLGRLRPSEHAKAFHAQVVQYLNKSKAYGLTIKKMLAARGNQKEIYYKQAALQSAELENMPDQIRDTQVAYQDKAGLKR